MAYNSQLAERVANELNRKQIPFLEKKMFGGTCFMVDDKMCIGVVKDNLMVRANPNDTETLLQKDGAAPMDFTGKSMKGFLFIDENGWDADADLDFWIDVCLAYNPMAKSSKKKK